MDRKTDLEKHFAETQTKYDANVEEYFALKDAIRAHMQQVALLGTELRSNIMRTAVLDQEASYCKAELNDAKKNSEEMS